MADDKHTKNTTTIIRSKAIISIITKRAAVRTKIATIRKTLITIKMMMR